MTTAALPSSPDSARVQSTSRHAWIVTPWFDTAFFLLSGLVVFLPWIASKYYHADPNTILTAVALASNGPHLTSTWTRVYLDRAELQQRPFAYLGVPALIAVLVAWLAFYGDALPAMLSLPPDGLFGFRVINSGILYYATYHFAAQCYGLLRIYQRKADTEERFAYRAERVFVYSIALTGILGRMYTGPRNILGVEAIAPQLNAGPALFFGFISAACLLVILADQATRKLQGHRFEWPRMLFLLATLLGFLVPFFLIEDGSSAFAAAACWHGFQYLGIVYFFNKNKFADQPKPDGAELIWWVSQSGRAVPYAMLLFALAGLGLVVIFVLQTLGVDSYRSAATVWTTLTISHYWVDGLIWKLRQKPNAAALKLA